MKKIIKQFTDYCDKNNGRNTFCWLYILIMFGQIYLYILSILTGNYDIIFMALMGIIILPIEFSRNIRIEHIPPLTWTTLLEKSIELNWSVNNDKTIIKIPTISDHVWYKIIKVTDTASRFIICQLSKRNSKKYIWSGITLNNKLIWVYIQPYQEKND